MRSRAGQLARRTLIARVAILLVGERTEDSLAIDFWYFDPAELGHSAEDLELEPPSMLVDAADELLGECDLVPLEGRQTVKLGRNLWQRLVGLLGGRRIDRCRDVGCRRVRDGCVERRRRPYVLQVRRRPGREPGRQLWKGTQLARAVDRRR